MKTIVVDEIEVPVDVIVEVSTLLNESGVTNQLKGGNEDAGTVTVEIQYDRRDNEEKEAVLQIEEVINEYHGFSGEQEEEENDDNN